MKIDRGLAITSLLLLTLLGTSPATAAPEGQLTWGVHISLAPTWFDPAETSGIITPFMVLYALHDSLVKPMPGNGMAPSLAESWSASPDGLLYEFILRKGVKFHNGDPVTAEDVKFSFERYRGAAYKTFKESVAAVEIADPARIRFRLKRPWPDFATFYLSATGASWIVPKKYVEKVGDEGFKKAPVGAGPYKFVSFTPGVELVLEAFDQYWRKVPNVKRLTLRAIPDEATHLAALKRGEVDIAFAIRGALAEDLRRTPGLTLKPNVAFGNAAARIEAFVAGGGTYAYGSYGDIDGFFREQATDMDPKRREATLDRIQQLVHDKVMFAPIWLTGGLSGIGPRVEEPAIGLVAGYTFSAPFEEVKLKAR